MKLNLSKQRPSPSFRCDYARGGGVTTIYAGMGCAIFWGAFFRAENKFWGIVFGKITGSHKFLGVILEKELFRVLILIKFHLLGSNFGWLSQF